MDGLEAAWQSEACEGLQVHIQQYYEDCGWDHGKSLVPVYQFQAEMTLYTDMCFAFVTAVQLIGTYAACESPVAKQRELWFSKC